MRYGILLFVLTRFVTATNAQNLGTLDPQFGNQGIGAEHRTFFESITAVEVQPDGKIVAAGFKTDNFYSALVVMRYHSDGSLDASFANGGLYEGIFKSNINMPTGIALQSDGKIIVAGYTADDENAEKVEDILLLRLLPTGAPDNNFGSGGATILNLGENERPSAVKVTGDGKIYVAGGKYLGTKSSFFACRFLSNGTLDTGFGSAQTGSTTFVFNASWNFCYDLEIQPDGKILLAGEGTVSSYRNFGLMRLLNDGTLDPSFGTGGKIMHGLNTTNASPVAMELRPDGKILLGGNFLKGGKANFGLMQLMPDGSPDNSFGTGGVVNTPVGDAGYAMINDLTINADGSFLAAGTAMRKVLYFDIALVKYTASGDLETGFGNNGIIFTDYTGHHEGVADIAIQSDGKLIIAGSGVDIENTATNFLLARYFFDGSTGNEEISDILAFSTAFPNPARPGSLLQLSYGLNGPQRVDLELYSINGALLGVLSSEQKSEGRHLDAINLPSGLAPGLYLLGVRTGAGQAFVKINIF